MCTKIPYYKQVILMSFYCEHCGYRNNEIQSGEAAQEHGTKITVTVKDAAVGTGIDILAYVLCDCRKQQIAAFTRILRLFNAIIYYIDCYFTLYFIILTGIFSGLESTSSEIRVRRDNHSGD